MKPKLPKKPSLPSKADGPGVQDSEEPGAEVESESEPGPATPLAKLAEKTSVQTPPDEFGNPEKPNIDEPFVEDPFDPESDTKLTQLKINVKIMGEWLLI